MIKVLILMVGFFASNVGAADVERRFGQEELKELFGKLISCESNLDLVCELALENKLAFRDKDFSPKDRNLNSENFPMLKKRVVSTRRDCEMKDAKNDLKSLFRKVKGVFNGRDGVTDISDKVLNIQSPVYSETTKKYEAYGPGFDHANGVYPLRVSGKYAKVLTQVSCIDAPKE